MACNDRDQLSRGLVVAALFAAAAAAHASPVDLRFQSTGRGQTVRIYSDGYESGRSVFAGQLRWTVSNVPTDANWLLSEDLRTYCIDLAQGVSYSSQTYMITEPALTPLSSPMGEEKSRALHNMLSGAGGSILTSAATDTDAAAFQLAVWDIVTDFSPTAAGNGLGLNSGRFLARGAGDEGVSPSLQSRYAEFIAEVAREAGRDMRVVALASPQHQDQMTIIPSPAGAALLCIGGLMIRRGRRAGV